MNFTYKKIHLDSVEGVRGSVGEGERSQIDMRCFVQIPAEKTNKKL